MRSLPALPLALPTALLLCIFATAPAAASLATEANQPARPRPGPGAAPSARELAALRAAEHLRAQAVASRDVDTLRNLISGDYYHVETTGRVRTKTEFLQLLARDEFEFREYEIDDMEIRMLDNGRAAVVTGRFRATLQGAPRQREFRGRYVRMWLLGPGGWRNTMQQSTEIRPLAPQRDTRAQ